MSWTVLVPVKALSAAKTRLAPGLDPAAHRRLVTAIRADTLDAARSAAGVERLLLVVDRLDAGSPDVGSPGSGPADEVIVQRRPGLNAALAEAAQHARERRPGTYLAALLGDLPALRADELAATLAAACSHAHGFVRDADGTGTTLLTTLDGPWRPSFGSGSAARHAAFATELAAGPGLRRDVDDAADLAAAERLGLGPHTASVVETAGYGRSSRRGIVGA